MLVEATPTVIGRWQGNLIICLINQLYTHTMYTFYPEDRTQHFAYTTLLKMGCYLAPPPLACTGGGCYITPRGVIEYYLGVIEYYLGAAGVRTSAILTSYTLQVCSYTPQISPLTFGTLWFSTATRPIQVSMHHPS